MPRSRKRKCSSSISATHDKDQENERYFLDPEAVSRHLYCSICQEVFIEPQRAPCGHSFCKECIYTWLQHKKNCPEDRRPMKRSDLHYDFIVANVIGDHTVACPFRRKGCEYLGKLDTISMHRKSCVFNPGNLPSFLHKEKSIMSAQQPTSPAVETSGTSSRTENVLSPLVPDNDKLPTPAKPSLKMRLFCKGGGQRDLLCSMFDDSARPTSSSSSSSSSSSIAAVATAKGTSTSAVRQNDYDDVFILDSP